MTNKNLSREQDVGYSSQPVNPLVDRLAKIQCIDYLAKEIFPNENILTAINTFIRQPTRIERRTDTWVLNSRESSQARLRPVLPCRDPNHHNGLSAKTFEATDM